MAQPTNTGSSFKYNTIREDLSNIVYKISPLETPGMQAVGKKGKFESVLHEWPIVELAAANANNAVVEGGDATNDAPTTAFRRSNYAQLMNKTKQVSTTNDKIRGAGDVQKMVKQILYGTQELKRDMEARLMGPGSLIAAVNSDTQARLTASLAAFLMTNTSRGATGASGTLSGGGVTNGYPSVAETAGTPRTITETMLKTVIQAAWTQGGSPSLAFCGGTQKIQISTFTGNATRFKTAEDKKLVAAIDVYVSDFGELQIVPDRFQDATRVLVVDPELVEVGYLQTMNNTPLAKTGNSTRRLVAVEWGVIVGNEKGCAQVTDLQ